MYRDRDGATFRGTGRASSCSRGNVMKAGTCGGMRWSDPPLHAATSRCDSRDRRLAAVIEAIERLGVTVECPALDARARLRTAG